MITIKKPVFSTPDNDVKIYRDALSHTSVEMITELIEKCLQQDIYSHTSFDSWEPGIVDKSAEIKVLYLNADYPSIFHHLSRELFIRFKINPVGLHLNIHFMKKDCYINDHSDSHVDFAFTVYFNKNWVMEDGGIFQFIKDDVTYGILPEYNKMVMIRDTKHRVSRVNKDKCRITIQGFYCDDFKYKGKNISEIILS
jgi:Rps23 Pro-64 3,4-dihydroxylase Tpa1-like proline 4-hydroxylase